MGNYYLGGPQICELLLWTLLKRRMIMIQILRKACELPIVYETVDGVYWSGQCVWASCRPMLRYDRHLLLIVKHPGSHFLWLHNLTGLMVQYCSDVDGIPEAILEEWQYMYRQHISSKHDMIPQFGGLETPSISLHLFSKCWSCYWLQCTILQSAIGTHHGAKGL